MNTVKAILKSINWIYLFPLILKCLLTFFILHYTLCYIFTFIYTFYNVLHGLKLHYIVTISDFYYSVILQKFVSK